MRISAACSAGTHKAAQWLEAFVIDDTVFAEPLPTGEDVGFYLPYRPSRIAIARLAAHAATRAKGGRMLRRDHPTQDADVRPVAATARLLDRITG